MGGSGAGSSCSTDGNCGNRSNSRAAFASSQVLGSSREVRSVSSSSNSQLQPIGESSDDEDSEDEYESQPFHHWSPLPQGSNTSFQLPPSPPLSPSSEDGDEILLRIPAFAQELYLMLKRNSHFLAPGFSVEERLMSVKRNFPNAQGERSCYYNGSVLHHPGSFASFSTCGGLVRFAMMTVLSQSISPFFSSILSHLRKHFTFYTFFALFHLLTSLILPACLMLFTVIILYPCF